MLKKNYKFKLSPSYKNLGPWKIIEHELFEDDLTDLSDSELIKVRSVISDLELHPYQGRYGQHPLWQFYDTEGDYVIWSAIILNDLRLTYRIFKSQNVIEVLSVGNHKVLNYTYSK